MRRRLPAVAADAQAVLVGVPRPGHALEIGPRRPLALERLTHRVFTLFA